MAAARATELIAGETWRPRCGTDHSLWSSCWFDFSFWPLTVAVFLCLVLIFAHGVADET